MCPLVDRYRIGFATILTEAWSELANVHALDSQDTMCVVGAEALLGAPPLLSSNSAVDGGNGGDDDHGNIDAIEAEEKKEGDGNSSEEVGDESNDASCSTI